MTEVSEEINVITSVSKQKEEKRAKVRRGKKIIPLPLPEKRIKTISDDPCKVFFGFTSLSNDKTSS